jgi:hypothetical protein
VPTHRAMAAELISLCRVSCMTYAPNQRIAAPDRA